MTQCTGAKCNDGYECHADQHSCHFGHCLSHVLTPAHSRFDHALNDLGSGQLIYSENRRGLSVEPASQVVSLRAEINPRNVLDPHKRTVRVRPNDNLPEFLRCLQSSLGAHGISEFLSTWNWFAADLAGGIHRVLLLHCGDDVRHSDAEFRELVRLDPKAHSVLASAENLHIANSRHACQWIEDINVAVIGEKNAVI